MSKTASDSGAGRPPDQAPVVFDPAKSKARLLSWFPQLDVKLVDKLIIYLSELNKFNKAVNLVSPNTLATADAVHIADAVFAQRAIVPALVSGHPLYDFGSGNGFPGLVFGILNPTLKVILVDRDERKLEFCKHVASATGASNVTTMKADVEALPEKSVINAVARGFAPLGKAMLVARKVMPKGGKFFHLKGDQWAMELSQVPSQLFSFWQPSLIGEYRLPDQGAEMGVVLTDKSGD